MVVVVEVFVDKKAPCLPACLDRAMLCRVGVLLCWERQQRAFSHFVRAMLDRM